MVLTAAILLAAYTVSIVVVLLKPSRQHDPQRGQAVGCLMIVVIGLVALGGVLALAAVYDVRWLVTTIFSITVYPAVMIAASLIVRRRKTGKWTK
ncbi:MAG TPA: hypothetical protein VF796_15535 [Humisphaera sp.]